MEQRTHEKIAAHLCGTPIALSEGKARVALEVSPEMAADGRGLAHGGFTFGLADYAAMLAVNDKALAEKLDAYRAKQTDDARAMSAQLK